MSQTPADVLAEVRGHVGFITLNRPRAINALSLGMVRDLLAQLLILAFTSFVRGSDGLPLFAITLSPLLALQIAAIATVCGVLAAVAPARRAARLDPALAIRM